MFVDKEITVAHFCSFFTGRETVPPRETSSEDVGKQKVPKSSRSSPPSRTPVPRESLPSAKRLKLSKEHLNAQSEEKDQKQVSYFLHYSNPTIL